MNALDDISRRRNRHKIETQPFELDCDTHDCHAQGTFDALAQAAGWGRLFVRRADGETDVMLYCPRCAQHTPCQRLRP